MPPLISFDIQQSPLIPMWQQNNRILAQLRIEAARMKERENAAMSQAIGRAGANIGGAIQTGIQMKEQRRQFDEQMALRERQLNEKHGAKMWTPSAQNEYNDLSKALAVFKQDTPFLLGDGTPSPQYAEGVDRIMSQMERVIDSQGDRQKPPWPAEAGPGIPFRDEKTGLLMVYDQNGMPDTGLIDTQLREQFRLQSAAASAGPSDLDKIRDPFRVPTTADIRQIIKQLLRDKIPATPENVYSVWSANLGIERGVASLYERDMYGRMMAAGGQPGQGQEALGEAPTGTITERVAGNLREAGDGSLSEGFTNTLAKAMLSTLTSVPPWYGRPSRAAPQTTQADSTEGLSTPGTLGELVTLPARGALGIGKRLGIVGESSIEPEKSEEVQEKLAAGVEPEKAVESVKPTEKEKKAMAAAAAVTQILSPQFREVIPRMTPKAAKNAIAILERAPPEIKATEEYQITLALLHSVFLRGKK